MPRTKPKSVYSKRPLLLERNELGEVAGRREYNYSKIADNASTRKYSLLAGESKLVAVHLNRSPPHSTPTLVFVYSGICWKQNSR